MLVVGAVDDEAVGDDGAEEEAEVADPVTTHRLQVFLVKYDMLGIRQQ